MKKISLFLLFTILCFNFSTAQVFEKRFSWNLSTTYFAEVTACTHRSNGNNLIAIHQSLLTGQGAAALAEINANGDTLWTKKFNRAGTSYGENYITFIRELPDHSIFMAGGTHNSSGYYHAALWLADSSGTITSYKQFAYNTYREITINDIDIADDGSIYFAGNYFDLFSGGVSYYTWNVPLYGKLNPDLTLAWGSTWGSTDHTNNNRNIGNVVGIKVAPDNNVIVLGSDAVDFSHGYNGTMQLAKVTPGGVIIWKTQRSMNTDSYLKSLMLGNNGEIYALTNFNQAVPATTHHHLLEKFTSSGNLLWAKSFGTNLVEYISRAKFNNYTNAIIIVGNHQDAAFNSMAFQLTLDTAGTPLQSKIYGEAGTTNNYFNDVSCLPNNYLIAGNAYTFGGMLVQTDHSGNTGCAANSINFQQAAFTSNAFTQGIYHSGFNFTFTPYTANYIPNPITSTQTCYTCGDVSVYATVNSCGSYYVAGALQSASGIYYDTLASTGGCDSIIVTNLTVYQNPSAANAGTDQNSCNNAGSIAANTPAIGTGIWSVISGGGTIVDLNDPTTGINNLSNGNNTLRWTISNGTCTSSYDEITIYVGTATTATISQTSCDSLTVNNTTYYTSGTYTQTLQNAGGCDSTLTINLAILNSSTAQLSAQACNTYNFNNQTYTQSGTYLQNLQNVAGCDSLVTLNLIINYSEDTLLSVQTCNEHFIFNNQTYTTSGTYAQLLQTAAGCDSTITIDLTIHPAVDTSVTVNDITLVSNVLNAQYQWWNCNTGSIINGATNEVYTAAANGDYAVIINSNGCIDTSGCYGIYTVGMDLVQNTFLNFEIVPNPNEGAFLLQSNTSISSLRIINLQGELVWHENNIAPNSLIKPDTISTGLYFIQVESNQHTAIKKLIIR